MRWTVDRPSDVERKGTIAINRTCTRDRLKIAKCYKDRKGPQTASHTGLRCFNLWKECQSTEIHTIHVQEDSKERQQ